MVHAEITGLNRIRGNAIKLLFSAVIGLAVFFPIANHRAAGADAPIWPEPKTVGQARSELAQVSEPNLIDMTCGELADWTVKKGSSLVRILETLHFLWFDGYYTAKKVPFLSPLKPDIEESVRRKYSDRGVAEICQQNPSLKLTDLYLERIDRVGALGLARHMGRKRSSDATDVRSYSFIYEIDCYDAGFLTRNTDDDEPNMMSGAPYLPYWFDGFLTGERDSIRTITQIMEFPRGTGSMVEICRKEKNVTFFEVIERVWLETQP